MHAVVEGTRKARAKPAGRPSNIAEVRKRGFDTGTIAAIEQIDPEKPLTELQNRFVKFWASGESILSAAHRAGYSDGGAFAYRLVKYPNVLKLYNEEKRLYEEAAQMSRKKVMDMLLEAYDHAKLAGEPSSMVAAAREVGKMCGYYEPTKVRIDVNHTGNIIHERLNQLSDSELLEILTKDPTLALEGPK
jgi:hypothetical protein